MPLHPEFTVSDDKAGIGTARRQARMNPISRARAARSAPPRLRERRRHPRDLAGIATICSSAKASQPARITDVSHCGCRLACGELPGRVGERVLLKLGSYLIVPARVCWAGEGQVGLEFDSPLHGAMLLEKAWAEATSPLRH